jgi:hypothetical protein
MVLPTVQFDSFDTPVATKLQPVFDALWNAAGWPRCMDYNDSGDWVG